jgi:hypothetical protein
VLNASRASTGRDAGLKGVGRGCRVFAFTRKLATDEDRRRTSTRAPGVESGWPSRKRARSRCLHAWVVVDCVAAAATQATVRLERPVACGGQHRPFAER